jgi:putative ABC transport system ATP-binding protein
VLQVEHLSKNYGGSRVFANVDFTVAPGEFVAIVGDSGVGKSTLLNCLAGLDHWDRGSVIVKGTDVGGLNETERALWRRENVGFVFQAFHVLPHLDVTQNVTLPLMLLGRNDATRVEQMLHAVGLQGLGKLLPQQLSGGQLQRVAIARALVHSPAVLLADEPTGNLDSTTADSVLHLLHSQTRRCSSSLLMVTHSAVAAARADRILRLGPEGMHAQLDSDSC